MDYPQKYLELDRIFLKVRKKQKTGFRDNFDIDVEKVIENTQITDKEDLKVMLERLKNDPLLKVKGDYEPLIKEYEDKGDKMTIIGCPTKNIKEHISIINQYEQDEEDGEKMTIYIDENNGIYLDKEKKEPRYKIGRKSRRFRIILKLKNQSVIMGDELCEEGQILQGLSRDIREINNNIIKKLDIENIFITRHDTGGYSMNTKNFNPIFILISS